MTLISQDDHLTSGTWVACGVRDLANASLWSRKRWSKLKTTFLFLSVYSNWTRDASLHPYCSPNIWHPTRGIDGCTFYFSPIFKLFREIFYETTTQLSNVEHGLENQSWPASPISRAKFSKENLRNYYMYCCAKHAKKNENNTRNLGRSLTAVFKSATKTQANAMLTVADWVSVVSVIPKMKCSLICFF